MTTYDDMTTDELERLAETTADELADMSEARTRIVHLQLELDDVEYELRARKGEQRFYDGEPEADITF